MASTSASIDSSTSPAPKKYSYYPPRPRRFAPLNPEHAKRNGTGDDVGLPKLRGVIFDVDGTLCLPQNYMFKQMREALQIPKSVDILNHIRSLPSEPDGQAVTSTETTADGEAESSSSPQSRAAAKIRAIERSAMTSQTPQPGLVELMTYLDSRHILKGLCTRNFPAPVQHLLDRFLAPHGVSFAPEEVITRESKGIQPKPSPEGIWTIGRHWTTTHGLGLEAERRAHDPAPDGADENDTLDLARKYLAAGLIMVGDSIDDMTAGHRAGAATVLLANEDNEWLADHEYTDLAIRRLDDLVGILERGFEGTVSM